MVSAPKTGISVGLRPRAQARQQPRASSFAAQPGMFLQSEPSTKRLHDLSRRWHRRRFTKHFLDDRAIGCGPLYIDCLRHVGANWARTFA